MRNLKLALVATTLIAGGAYAKGPDPTEATVKGSLAKDLIRGVVQKHLHEVKLCYERELEKNQNLAGRLLVNFTISTEGKVSESKLEQSTLGNATVEKCVVEAVRGWEFPKPKGGTVVVSYPFVMHAADPEGEKAGAPHK